jgi:hypothetical protein
VFYSDNSDTVDIMAKSGQTLNIGSVHIGSTSIDTIDAGIIDAGTINTDLIVPKLINFVGGTQDDFTIDEDAGWIDINAPIIVSGSGNADPTISQIDGLVGMQLYTFPGTGSQIKQCWSQIHVPHNYKVGTGIFFHSHVLTDATVLTGNYKLFFDYTYASSNGVFSPVQTVSAIDNFTASLQHKITEISVPVLANELEVDGVVMIRMYRVPTDAEDTFTGDLHLIYIDCHMNVSKYSTKYRNKATTGSFYN